MSNIKFILQENLKNVDNNIYQEAKLQEIILLVKAFQSGIIDSENYEIYFNRKCLIDYKNLLISEITDEIEPVMKKNKKKLIQIYKVLFLCKLKLQSGNLEKYLSSFIEAQDLLDDYKPYVSIKKRIDIKKELKNKEEVQRLTKEAEVLKKNIIKISTDAISDMNEENGLDYDYIIEHIPPIITRLREISPFGKSA